MARPHSTTTVARRDEFIRLLATGVGWREAARTARFDPGAVLTMFDALGVSARALLAAQDEARAA